MTGQIWYVCTLSEVSADASSNGVSRKQQNDGLQCNWQMLWNSNQEKVSEEQMVHAQMVLSSSSASPTVRSIDARRCALELCNGAVQLFAVTGCEVMCRDAVWCGVLLYGVVQWSLTERWSEVEATIRPAVGTAIRVPVLPPSLLPASSIARFLIQPPGLDQILPKAT